MFTANISTSKIALTFAEYLDLLSSLLANAPFWKQEKNGGVLQEGEGWGKTVCGVWYGFFLVFSFPPPPALSLFFFVFSLFFYLDLLLKTLSMFRGQGPAGEGGKKNYPTAIFTEGSIDQRHHKLTLTNLGISLSSHLVKTHRPYENPIE